MAKKTTGKVKVRFTLSIGIQGKQEGLQEYDAEDVPSDDDEREEWLNEQWKAWSANYIDGSASIEE